MPEKNLGKIGEIKRKIEGTLKNSDTPKNTFDKDFYKDVDRIKNKGCCTLPFIIVILIIIFGLIIYGLVYFKNITHLGIDYLSQNRNSSQQDLTNSFIEKTKQINPGETMILDFSEVEVSEYLGLSDPDFPIKKSRLRITEKGIVINGRLSESFFSLPVEIYIRPKIDQNKLTFILDDIATSSISLPKIAKDKINAYLDIIMKSKNLYDSNLEIISASTADKSLKIEVHKKP